VSVSVPLSVALSTARGFRHITNEISDFTFGSTSPGGYADCTVSLYRPIRLMPGEVGQFGRLYVYDGQTGETVYEGRLQDPGRSAGDDGESFQLAAIGGQAHLQDDTRQLYYVDADPSNWDQIDVVTPAAQVDQLQDTGAVAGSDTPALVLRIPQGTSVDGANSPRSVASHRGIASSGMKLSRVSFTWKAGQNATSLVASLYAATSGVGAADVPWTATFSTTGGSIAKTYADWTLGRNRPILRFHYNGAAGVVNADTWWVQITNLVVRTVLYQSNGTEWLAGGAYAADTINASNVVGDLLGRVLQQTIDGANATIHATSFAIDHLVYPDGATPAKILDDMMLLEQGYTYHLWESNPANGKFRFEWVAWPVVPRYEADVLDGFAAPASGNTVFNRVAVRYHNRGTIRVPVRTQTVQALTDAGFDRTAFIDLGDEASTQVNAERVGDQFLAEHKVPVNAGRLTIRRPIVDFRSGRMVNPWEIRPGELIRVKGVESYPDSLNSDGRDGITVFKIAATSYSSADNAATLELDSYTPSVARMLAKVKRRGFVRRR